jgi:nitrate reductase NapE component
LIVRLEQVLRAVIARVHRDERGQEVLTWLLVLFVLWLILAGRRVVVQ